MSKFLRVLVNIFLVVAILIAAAILIPPLAGVSTTIVDSASMDTNLPLGSVTYSTNVDVSKLNVGDEILKDNDISTYAYIIRSGDETTGQYRAVSAADPEGVEEDIVLRNTVPKVAVVVPYIGYIMIAMHSVEGLIIIALVVILMIILFILSELWKPRDDDDDEDQDAVVSAGLSEENENGIDTAAIRAALRENHANANASSNEQEQEADEENLTRAERRALKKARKQAEKDAKAAAKAQRAAGDSGVEPFAAAAEQTASQAAGASDEILSGIAAAAADAGDNGPEVIRSAFDRASGTEDILRDSGSRAEPGSDVMNRKTRDLNQVAREVRESLASGEQAGVNMADPDELAAEAASIPADNVFERYQDIPQEADDIPAETAPSFEAGSASSGDADDTDGIRIIEPEVFLRMEDKPAEKAAEPFIADIVPEAEAAPEPDDDVYRFTPVKRPSLSEMIDQAKALGESPAIVQDDQTGMTMIDYSDLL